MKKSEKSYFIKRLRGVIKSTLFLTNGIFLIGGAISIIGLVFLNRIPNHTAPEICNLLLLLPALLGMITSGIFTIIRREIPRFGLPSINGITAIIIGIIAIIFWSGLLIILLYRVFVILVM